MSVKLEAPLTLSIFIFHQIVKGRELLRQPPQLTEPKVLALMQEIHDLISFGAIVRILIQRKRWAPLPDRAHKIYIGWLHSEFLPRNMGIFSLFYRLTAEIIV